MLQCFINRCIIQVQLFITAVYVNLSAEIVSNHSTFVRRALSFYKGILPPLLAETPKRGVKFFTFERYKNMFSYGENIPQPIVFTLEGLSSGLTEAFVINPFEVVKVRLQSQRSTFQEQPSTIKTAKEIIAKDGLGLKGLNKGLTTLGRHGVFNMVYFSFYHNVKGMVPEQEVGINTHN